MTTTTDTYSVHINGKEIWARDTRAGAELKAREKLLKAKPYYSLAAIVNNQTGTVVAVVVDDANGIRTVEV